MKKICFITEFENAIALAFFAFETKQSKDKKIKKESAKHGNFLKEGKVKSSNSK